MPRGQNFYFRCYQVVRRIPKGRVATYGQVATLLGNPRAARMVGWALNALKPDTKVPWQRVINREGYISTRCLEHPKVAQKALLEDDGVEVSSDFVVNLEKYGWWG